MTDNDTPSTFVSFLEKIACGPTKTKIYNANNGTKENKEGTGRPSESGHTEKWQPNEVRKWIQR
jgi:hypothetical protein